MMRLKWFSPKTIKWLRHSAFDSPHIRFRIGIQIWTSRRNGPKVYAVGFQGRTKLIGELGVSIANDMRRLELGFLFSKDHTHVPSRQRHPIAVGIRRHAGYVDPSRVQWIKKST